MNKMPIKKLSLIFIFITIVTPIKTLVFAGSPISMNHHDVKEFLSLLKASPKIQQNSLPQPYQDLLRPPLLTKQLEKYYQRTAIVQKIYVLKNGRNNTYFRAIIMTVDKDKTRNNPRIAQKKHEARIVELAFITINLDALSAQMAKDILHTNVPFGSLLAKHKIEIYTTGRSYFSTRCSSKLAALVTCNLKTKIYGRTNTIMQKDSNKWLAYVVEVLP